MVACGQTNAALVALDAGGGVPGGNAHGHAALLVRRSALLELAVHVRNERGHGQAVAVHAAHRLHDLAHHLHHFGTALKRGGLAIVDGLGPAGRDLHLHERGGTRIDGAVVHIDDVLALLHIGLRGRILHVLDGLVLRDDVRQREERRLQDGVRALAHADLAGKVDGVDGVELDAVVGDIALGLGVQMMLKLFRRPLAVDHERAARLHVVHHAEALGDVGRVVAGHEVGLVHVIGAADGRVAEAQVADGHAAGLLRVVLEVGLHVLVGVVADDLDGVLVRAHGAVAAEAPELALHRARGRRVGARRVLGKRQVGHVVHDAHGELARRGVLLQLLVHGEHRRGRGVLRGQAVAAAHHGEVASALVRERVHHVHVQRLAERARLLRAVHDRDLLARGRQRRYELLAHERAVQAHLHQAHLLAVRVQVVHDLLHHVAERAHGHDHAVGVGRAVVVEQLVVRAELGVHLVHVVLDHGGQRIVDAVAGLAVLEEHVAVLMAAAHGGVLGVERVLAEGAHRVHVAHLGQVVVVPHGDLLHLVGGAEAVEEVDERHAALDGGEVRHGGQVHDLLHVRLGQHGEARLAAGHDVGVVAEDGERLRGHGARAHMEHARQLLGSHLVHVGDHEEQALRGRVGGGERAGGERTVDRARGTALGLHLAHLHLRAEDVLLAGSGPLVNEVGHRARRGDGIDARHLGERVGHVSRGVVAVHGFEFSRHAFLSS